MIEILENSMEARAIRVLQKIYPITVEELAKELHVSEKQIKLVIANLLKKGIIRIEELPDKQYVRLVRSDIKFIGRNPSQRKKLKHKHPPRTKTEGYEGIMYG